MSGASIIPLMGILGFILVTMGLVSGKSTIGFDCNTKLKKKIIPLQRMNHCDLATGGLNITSENIAVLQLNEFPRATILQCKIEIYRVIADCGSQPYDSVARLRYNEFIYPIAHRDCEIAFVNGTMTLGNTTITGLKENSISMRTIKLAGSINSTGACLGGNYSDPYGTWKDVIVTATAKITLQSHSVNVDVENDFIELPSGYNCKLSKGQCIDPEGGYTFRSQRPLRFCYDIMYSVLYNGTANKLKSKWATMFSVIVNNTRFSFHSNENETSCGATLFKTGSLRLFIVESKDLKLLTAFNILDTHTDNMNIFQCKKDNFVYVEKYILYPLPYLGKNILDHKCLHEKSSLKNMLSLASTQPDHLAFEYMGGLGYTAIVEEDWLQIVPCVPVVVELQSHDKSYKLQPILRGNHSLFLTPNTHIITNTAKDLSCNSSIMQDHKSNSSSRKPKNVTLLCMIFLILLK